MGKIEIASHYKYTTFAENVKPLSMFLIYFYNFIILICFILTETGFFLLKRKEKTPAQKKPLRQGRGPGKDSQDSISW